MAFQWSAEDRSIGDGFIRIAREQIGKAIAIATDASEAPPRRVHEARRRAKKLRALLRLVRSGYRDYPAENAFIRDAARRLSGTRDDKVAVDTLTELLAWTGREAPLFSLQSSPVDEEAALARYASDMQQMLERSERWKAKKIGIETLADGLTETYRRGRDGMREAMARPTDIGFHEWRKHTKYHWNQVGLLEASAPDILPSAHQAMNDLGDKLGVHHDLAMLRERLTANPALFGELDTGFVHDAALRRQRELEQRITTLGRQLYAETPKALRARFSQYLQGWAKEDG